MSDLDLAVTDGTRRLDLAQVWTDVTLVDGFVQAPHLTVQVHDPQRTLIADPLIRRSTWIPFDRRRHLLSGIAKDGSTVTLVGEDVHVRRLRAQRGELTVSASTPLARFVRRLARDADVPIVTVQVADLPEPYERGEDETSWDCIVRLATEARSRVIMEPGGLVVADDQTLQQRRTPVDLAERQAGVDHINFQASDGDVVAEQASVDLRAEPGQLQTGTPVRVSGLRPMDGPWLVSEVQWQPHRTATRVELVRPGGGL